MTRSCVAFGELMLRLDPAGGVRLVQASSFEARFTGAEANVAASLTQFGISSQVVSTVPDDALGDAALAFLRRFGVDTAAVRRRPGRLGLLYVEPGGAGRPGQVIYDRAGSVFAVTGAGAYDWKAILAGHDWLHVSGTAAAVGPGAAAALDQALTAARAAGVSVSLDPNYRSRLWTTEQAGRALRPLMDRVDVLLGAGEEAITILGLPAPHGWSPGRALSTDQRVTLLERARDQLGLRVAAGTGRATLPDGTVGLRGLVAAADGTAVSRSFPVTDERGRVGTGDAFAAGVIRGLLLGHPAQDVADFAAAAAYLKQSITGDINIASVPEVEDARSARATDRLRR
ncbi:MAG TPA: sugar kinase [Streptosporangiaceae bacterium]